MTAPLTPPHQPSSNDPWQTPPSGASPAPGPAPAHGREAATELRQAAVITALLTAAGLLLGLLWLWLAPRVPLVSDDTAVFLKNSEGEEAVAADGTFVLLALGFGVVAAFAVFFYRRSGGILLVAGLALGGLLGSLLAWGIGVWFGPSSDVVARAREAGKGVAFDAPLELHAAGVVLAWPIVAMLVHLGLTALFAPRDPEGEWAPEAPWGVAEGSEGAEGSDGSEGSDAGPGESVRR
ncbi:ABC transporter permease [Streptomyces fulvorobeus]|uniref:ABC transporter permease n=1 Tax=Streptomyces fulvorobeus TaxID=284028 RepID=A0A7J0C2A7_9ACTN|nr:ABC transporter permease [Streptomyces fulvorobeus]NYE40266.1 hypothetical protein [Streptomyces fulvorobeus]GFM96538.1 hypothetical protein Sfulv_13490 [Streptomyces fulvorobeus]